MHDYHLQPTLMERRQAVRFQPHWVPEVKTTVYGKAEFATKAHEEDRARWKVYTDGSGIDGGVGAAAVITYDGVIKDEVRLYVGPEEHHEVYEVEVVGLALGIILMKKHRVNSRTSIWVDNQAAILAIGNAKAGSSHYLLDIIHSLIHMHRNRAPRCEILIRWIPGHTGIQGNEKADKAAKAAAQLDVSDPSEYPLPHAMTKILPRNRASIVKTYRKQLQGSHDSMFEKSPCHGRFTRLWPGGATQSSNMFRRLATDLPKKHTSVLTQLLTGHIGLNHYLHRFNIAESPTCPCCKESEETVVHFLLRCPAHTRERNRLRTRLRNMNADMKQMLTTRSGVRETLRYVEETGRLQSVFGTIPELPPDTEDKE
ncbi:hypothetical protein E1B28_002802 [Marasmius oreades]|uniref:RNase H type-1 domain-containing protein n=1 Tax=Marasmius oreades TaxID=181124 RepID=A0A9P7UL94_9AGAR|nr:uncharacterized protein E1B28_002802 [Marasmius oreades]KAG7086882.1 hypothetical protein E1B28_002802 [Marasmius oreades]